MRRGRRRVFAVRDSRNRVVRIAVDFPGVQLQRVAWYENENLLLPALSMSMEFVQNYLPLRVASNLDLALNVAVACQTVRPKDRQDI